MPEIRDTDTFFPHLAMQVGDMPLAFVPRTAPRSLTGPPYVQTFTVRRRVRSFSASEWTATVFDCSGDAFEKFLVAMHDGNSGSDGRVSYQMGFTSSSGASEKYPKVYGIVRRVSPTYMREGVRLTIEGVDLGMEEARAAIAVDKVLNPKPKWTIAQWVEGAFAPSGVNVSVNVLPVGKLDGITLSQYSAYLGVVEDDGAAMVMSRIQTRAAVGGDLSTISVYDFFTVVADYVAYCASGTEARFRIDGLDETGKLTVTVIADGHMEGGVSRTYVVNSQEKKDETDSISVENFSVALDPTHPNVFLSRAEKLRLFDRSTRRQYEVQYTQDNEDGTVVGSGLLVAKQNGSLNRLSPREWPGIGGRDSAAVDIAGNAFNYDQSVVERARRMLARKFTYFPMTGSMTVHFPRQDLQPWTYVGVRVLTNNGTDPITSGRYLVTDMTYNYGQGQFDASVSILKSGGRSVPGDNNLGANTGTSSEVSE